MHGSLSRRAAVAAVLPVGLALSALAGSARATAAPTNPLTVTGSATCNSGAGHATWTLRWRIDHTVAATLPVTVVSARETGVVNSDITSTVSPNPIAAGETATATDGPIANTVGDIILTVTAVLGGGGTTVIGAIHLDGSCKVITPTTIAGPTTTLATTTTAAPAVTSAVVAQPTFTG